MMHLHLLKPPEQFIGSGAVQTGSAATPTDYGGAAGKGHPETIVVYSVPTKQVGTAFLTRVYCTLLPPFPANGREMGCKVG